MAHPLRQIAREATRSDSVSRSGIGVTQTASGAIIESVEVAEFEEEARPVTAPLELEIRGNRMAVSAPTTPGVEPNLITVVTSKAVISQVEATCVVILDPVNSTNA